MKTLRFAAFGAGFWSRFQLAAWRELPGVVCVALCDRDRARAEALAREAGIPAVYDDAQALLDAELGPRGGGIDFVDIITDPGTHVALADLAAGRGVPVICQKPLAPTLAEGEALVARCRERGVPLFVHENWRWQTPMRALAQVIAAGTIGTPFRARLDMISGFPVFDNQPFLRTLPQFILSDLGVHVLDAARLLFGEFASVYCRTRKIHQDIAGEDVATVLMESHGGVHVNVQLAYAGTPLERERFPETFVFVEGDRGSVELGPDHWIRVTTADGTHARRHPPPRFAWADPRYDVVQASMVPCNANLLAAIRGQGKAETTGADNVETLRLVFACYDSAASGAAIQIRPRGVERT